MTSQQFGPIYFQDAEAKQQGFAIVRAGNGQVGVALSLEEDGDIQVFLPIAQAQEVLTALQQAIDAAKGTTFSYTEITIVDGRTVNPSQNTHAKF